MARIITLSPKADFSNVHGKKKVEVVKALVQLGARKKPVTFLRLAEKTPIPEPRLRAHVRDLKRQHLIHVEAA